MGLTRKKITVRTKRGKSFQRSVMVRAEAIGKRTGGKKLNSLNPWEIRHGEHVNTNTKLGEKQRNYGTSGPGSSHSALAILTGLFRDQERARFEHPASTSATWSHSLDRQASGQHAARDAQDEHAYASRHPTTRRQGGGVAAAINTRFERGPHATYGIKSDLEERYGRDNIHQVYQDPRRHVR